MRLGDRSGETRAGASSVSERWLPWLVVGLGFLVLALAYSARATLGLVIPIWQQELGWSRSFTASAGATALIVMAVIAPVAGRLIDRVGARVTLALGLAALALSCLLVAVTESRLLFLLAFGGIGGLGFGIVAWHVVSTAIVRVMPSGIGFATGIANTGSTAGQFVLIPLLAIVLAYASWRWSFLALALASALLIPVVWCLLADGVGAAAKRSDEPARETSLASDLLYLAKQPAFHLLFWSFFLCGYTTTGVIETHFLPYAAFCGFGPVPSATVYGFLSVINMLGMIAAGWLTDRMNRPLLLGSIYLIRGGSFLILMNVGADIETLILFAALFGVVDYSTVPVTVSLAASHLGVRILGLSMGLIAAGHNVGGALGAFLGGYLFDLYAQYDWVWLSSVWLAVLAGAMVFFLRDRPSAGAAAPA